MSHRAEDVTRSIGAPMHYQEGPTRDGVHLVLACDLAVKQGRMSIWPRGFKGQPLEEAKAAIDLAISIAESVGDDEIIISFPGTKLFKIVVNGYDGFWIAAVVESGHPVNKSLARLLRRTARRFGLKKVESSALCDAPDPSARPPVPSSGIPETAMSSPSQEARTPATGGSPEAVSKEVSFPSPQLDGN